MGSGDGDTMKGAVVAEGREVWRVDVGGHQRGMPYRCHGEKKIGEGEEEEKEKKGHKCSCRDKTEKKMAKKNESVTL